MSFMGGKLGIGVSLRNDVALAGVNSFVPSQLPSLAAWWKYSTGITSVADAVSQWSDVSGNGRHLLQATGSSQPTVTNGAIRFPNTIGATTHLKTAAFTLAQPFTVYLLMKQVTWNALGNNPRIFAGNTNDVTILYQIGTTPNLRQFGGAFGADNADLALDTYGVVCSVFNNASSLTQVGSATPTTGTAGTQSMTAFTLAANGSGASSFADIEVKEIMLFGAAHNAATRAEVIAYLSQVGGL